MHCAGALACLLHRSIYEHAHGRGPGISVVAPIGLPRRLLRVGVLGNGAGPSASATPAPKSTTTDLEALRVRVPARNVRVRSWPLAGLRFPAPLGLSRTWPPHRPAAAAIFVAGRRPGLACGCLRNSVVAWLAPTRPPQPRRLAPFNGAPRKEAWRRDRPIRHAAGWGKRLLGFRCRFSRRRRPSGSAWRA